MNPRVKEALLWGVVGLLTFLVLLQGYELLQDVRVDLAVKAGATVVVGVASAAITYVASGRVEDGGDGEGAATAESDATPPVEPGDGDAAADRDENETS